MIMPMYLNKYTYYLQLTVKIASKDNDISITHQANSFYLAVMMGHVYFRHRCIRCI